MQSGARGIGDQSRVGRLLRIRQRRSCERTVSSFPRTIWINLTAALSKRHAMYSIATSIRSVRDPSEWFRRIGMSSQD